MTRNHDPRDRSRLWPPADEVAIPPVGDVVIREPKEGWSHDFYEAVVQRYFAVRGAYPRTARMHPSTVLAIAPTEGVLPVSWPILEVRRTTPRRASSSVTTHHNCRNSVRKENDRCRRLIVPPVRGVATFKAMPGRPSSARGATVRAFCSSRRTRVTPEAMSASELTEAMITAAMAKVRRAGLRRQ